MRVCERGVFRSTRVKSVSDRMFGVWLGLGSGEFVGWALRAIQPNSSSFSNFDLSTHLPLFHPLSQFFPLLYLTLTLKHILPRRFKHLYIAIQKLWLYYCNFTHNISFHFPHVPFPQFYFSFQSALSLFLWQIWKKSS